MVRGSRTFLLSSLLVALVGCQRSPTAPPDETPPVLLVAFPAGGQYDRDGDGLLDLEIVFVDAGAGVDRTTLLVKNERSLLGALNFPANLLDVWSVEEGEDRVWLEETVPHLLPRGPNRIVVSVADHEGNRTTASGGFHLPALAFHAEIPGPPGAEGVVALTPNPAGTRLHAVFERFSRSFYTSYDLPSLAPHEVLDVGIYYPRVLYYDPRRNDLWAGGFYTDELARVHVSRTPVTADVIPLEWQMEVVGLAADEARDAFYLVPFRPHRFPGGTLDLYIQVRSLASGAWTRDFILLDLKSDPDFGPLLFNEAVYDGTRNLLYLLSSEAGGIYVVDPVAGVVVDQIDLIPSDPHPNGGGFSMARDGDRILTSLSLRGGIGIVPLGAPHDVLFSPAGGWVAMRVIGVPDGDEILVAGCCPALRREDTWVHAMLLLDPLGGVIEEVRRPEEPEAHYRALAISPNGRIVFAGQELLDDLELPIGARILVFLRR